MNNKELVDLDMLIAALTRVQTAVASERFQQMKIARHIFPVGNASGHNKIIEVEKQENGRWYITYGLELTDQLNILGNEQAL